MGKIERQIRELESYLQQASKITLAEAEGLLGVSESTARRLFAKMEQQGQAFRIHGGLQAFPEQKQEYNYQRMETYRLAQKKRIARAAIDEIGDVKTLFLDSGSTVYQFSLCLAEWLRAGRREQVSVFTNSLRNLQTLSGLANVQFIGGQYRENRQDCCGYLAEQMLRSLNFDLCFLGADGFDAELGASTMDMETASLGRIAVSHSQRRVVLMDSTKFSRSTLVTYVVVEDLDLLITDSELDEKIVSRVQEKGTRVLRV